MEWVVMGRVRILKIDDDGVMIGCINMDNIKLLSATELKTDGSVLLVGYF